MNTSNSPDLPPRAAPWTSAWRIGPTCARGRSRRWQRALVNFGAEESFALAAGLGPRTHVHGVGDGAEWILAQFGEQFGGQGAYVVDFYLVSANLAAAAAVIHAKNPTRWLRRQPGRLLENKVTTVLRALAVHLEPAAAREAPVRAAQRYLEQRRAPGLRWGTRPRAQHRFR